MTTRRLWILLVAWTVVVLAVALFWGNDIPRGGCWRLLAPSQRCLAELAELNERIFWTQTVPKLLVLLGSYIPLAVLTMVHILRLRPSRNGGLG